MIVVGDNPWIPTVTNLVFYVLTGILLYKMACRWTSPFAGAVMQVLFALWPSHIAMTGLAHYEPMFMWLLWLCIWWFLTRDGLGWAVITGLATGASVLTRQTLLPVPILWGLYAVCRGRPLIPVAVASLALATTIIPWAMRNSSKGVPVLISSNTGGAIYQGANDAAQADYNDKPVGEMYRKLNWNEYEQQVVMTEMAKDWIRRNPGRWIRLLFEKQVYFLGEDTTGFYWTLKIAHKSEGTLYKLLQLAAHAWWVGIWVLAALAAFMHRDELRTNPEWQFVLWIILFFVVTAAPFTIQPRYHIPFIPAVLLLSGWAFERARPTSL